MPPPERPALGRAKDLAREVFDDLQFRFLSGLLQRGYDRAGAVSIGLLDERIIQLEKRLGPGTLSKADQTVLSILKRIRAEMVDELDEQRDGHTNHL